MKLYPFLIAAFILFAVFEPWLSVFFDSVALYTFNILIITVLCAMFAYEKKQLELQGRAKEIVSMASHHISNSLSSVKWGLLMLLNGNFGKLTQEQEELVGKICKKNENLISFVEKTLSNPELKRQNRLCLKRENLNEVARLAIEETADEIKKKKIDFSFSAQENIPDILIDRQKMQMAIENLLSNAIKYTHTGGKISVSTWRKGNFVEFKIQDTGIGIKKSQQPKIFSKFFRGTNASEHYFEGHGLGLYFVKNIIASHNGKIWLNSKEGKGSNFYFILPIK